MEFSAPTLPLSPAAFKVALASGHGRAMQHARNHGLQGFEEWILDATAIPWFYDTQCNGYAEDWLAELCCLAGVVDEVIARIPERVYLPLRCAVLKELHLRGHAGALPALYDSCGFVAGDGNIAGLCEVIDLEGKRGFLFAARKLGDRLRADSDFWVDQEIVDRFDSQAGQGKGMELLEEGCREDPDLAAFYWGLQKCVSEFQATQRPEPSLAEMIERIHLGGEKIYGAMAWGRDATTEERQQVAAINFRRLPTIGLWNYLHYFSVTGFPELHDQHLELLQHPDEGVRNAATSGLSHHADERVRQAALRALVEGEQQLALELFRNCVRGEDLPAILHAVDSPATLQNEDSRHTAALALLDLMAGEGAGRDLRVAMWVYEHSPCMICREDAVKVMRELPDFPAWVARECLHDAREDIRSLVAG